jgi:lipopolysaccharide export system protein LptA
MMRFYNRLLRFRNAVGFVLVLALCASAAAIQCFAQDKPGSAPDEKRIQIASDLLTTDDGKGYAEFSGNVRVVQGTTIIVSDSLRVYYKESAGAGQKLAGSAGAVEKIVASGNVKINFEDKTAVSDNAEYMTETQVVVLSGENTKVTTPDESISGAKITLYRADGRVKVESGKGKRVEAIFYDSGKLDGN